MNAAVAVLLIGIAAESCLLVFVLLRIRRTLLRFAFVALLLNYIAMTGVVVGLQEGTVGPEWEGVALWTLVLSHPLTALFLLFGIHGEIILRRFPYVLGLLVPMPLLLWVAPPGGYQLSEIYLSTPLNWYLVLCLAIPLGEAGAAWHRTHARKSETFLFLVGAAIIVLTGPVYSFEFEALGLPEAVGANPGVPIAALLFAGALAVGNPLAVPRVPPGAPSDPHFPPGRVVVIDEPVSEASARFVRHAARAERPVLEILRDKGEVARDPPRNLAQTEMKPHARLASIVHATACEFLARRPAGIVYVRDLAYIVTLSGLRSTREVIESLEAAVRPMLGTVVVSLARLTSGERAEILAIDRVLSHTLKEPASEIEAIVDRYFGGGGQRLLEAFASGEGREAASVTFEDIPALCRFLGSTTGEFGRTSGDVPVTESWTQAMAHANRDLEALSRRGLVDASAGSRPAPSSEAAIDAFLVNSKEFWRERGPDSADGVAGPTRTRETFGERVRGAFVAALGLAGDRLFESEIRRLHKSPEDLRPEDVKSILENTEGMLDTLQETVDLPTGRADLEGKALRLRTLLLGIAEEVHHAA